MASIEAVDCLLSGGAVWNKYIQKTEGMIDLTFAELTGCDLRGRDFPRCDLSGGQLLGANLDGSSFSNTILKGARLTNVSLVDCCLVSVNATHVDLSKAIIRNSRFSDFILENADASDLVLENCQLQGGQVVNTLFDQARFIDLVLNNISIKTLKALDLRMLRCKFGDDCILTDWILLNPDVTKCFFRKCDIRNLSFNDGTFIDSELSHCNMYHLTLHRTNVTQLDLSASVVTDVDIASLKPATATLLNTAFVSCAWPRQSGRVTFAGSYIPSPHLLAQPVQDVFGVPPTIRREVGDAQYLINKLARAQGISERALLRLWGATSAFGQSLVRLIIFSALVVVLHALIFLAVSGELFGCHCLNYELYATEFGNMGQVFLGFSASTSSASNIWENAVLLSARISGILSLGFWITIASSKLNRLSSA